MLDRYPGIGKAREQIADSRLALDALGYQRALDGKARAQRLERGAAALDEVTRRRLGIAALRLLRSAGQRRARSGTLGALLLGLGLLAPARPCLRTVLCRAPGLALRTVALCTRFFSAIAAPPRYGSFRTIVTSKRAATIIRNKKCTARGRFHVRCKTLVKHEASGKDAK